MWPAKNCETKMEPKSEQDWKWKSILDAAITNSEMDRWETAVTPPPWNAHDDKAWFYKNFMGQDLEHMSRAIYIDSSLSK